MEWQVQNRVKLHMLALVGVTVSACQGLLFRVWGLGFNVSWFGVFIRFTEVPPVNKLSSNFGSFPKLGSLYRGPNNQDSSIWVSILGSPYFGKLPFFCKQQLWPGNFP